MTSCGLTARSDTPDKVLPPPRPAEELSISSFKLFVVAALSLFSKTSNEEESQNWRKERCARTFRPSWYETLRISDESLVGGTNATAARESRADLWLLAFRAFLGVFLQLDPACWWVRENVLLQVPKGLLLRGS